MTDANNNTINYTYDPNSGNVVTATGPTVSVNGSTVSAQVRNIYTPYQAYYLNSSGSQVASGAIVYRLSSISACRTTANCAGTADETKTTYNWGPQTTGTGNNLLLASTTVAAGDSSLSSGTGYGYNSAGDRSSITDPLGNTTNFVYDLDHEVTIATTPDPDGSGPLNRRTTLYHYTPLGEVDAIARGYAGSNGFVYLQSAKATYDAAGRLLTQTIPSGDSTTYGLTQYSYDADGRLDCTAQRMNPSAYGSLPDACSLGTQGSYGPDRIGRNEYDGVGHITKVWRGYRSSIANATVQTYTPNGKLQTLIDPNGNRTGYVYDGFDRLFQTFYPSPNSPGSSSSTDYEQLGYDANGNVTSRRLRDGKTLGFSYDVLNRLIGVTNSASDPSLTYAYDLIGHQTGAGDSNNHLLATGYDALGRVISEADVFGPTRTFQYDAAGRRTRMQWSDAGSPVITYQYDAVNEMIGIVENGSTQLVTFAYDDLGRRTSKAYGNGTSTSYGYDGASRLNSLALNGSSFPDTITLGSYSPASEIGSRTQSNDSFSYNQAVKANVGYSVNGLNQYTAIAGVAQGYDGRGNLTTSGSTTYTYNSYNELTRVNGAPTGYYYDPANRLDTIAAEALWLSYDGDKIVSEISQSGSTVARRYVYGPGPDEPLIWYEGSGTSDRRYLDADERGSIVRTTDRTGAIKSVNAYDEYGIPLSGNGITTAGRFQYTGQIWLPSLGMYDYKARMYSPTLGRFMQTDPIGYADGPNWYNYVGGDPVNGSDPSGTDSGSNEYIYDIFDFNDIVAIGSRNIDYPIHIDTSHLTALDIGGVIRDDMFNFKISRSPQNKQCAGPPVAPGTGTTPAQLAAQAKSNGDEAAQHSYDPFWFKSEVQNKGPWDYKQYSPGNPTGYQNFGNYNYGYTGAAAGIPDGILLRQAGRAQQAAGTSQAGWGDPGIGGIFGGTPPYGDDPADQAMIQRGINDRKNGC